MTESTPTAVVKRRTWRPSGGDTLELFALTGIAVVQPLFDLLGRTPSLFVGWRATPPQFVALVVIVVFVPTLVLWLVEALVGLYSARARERVHVVIIGVLGGIIAVEIFKKFLGPAITFAIGVAAGVTFVFLHRAAIVRSWLRVLACAPALFAVLFVSNSAVTPIAFRDHVEVAKDVAIEHAHRVVMIVLDEFPLVSLLDGHGAIDATLFPTFAKLSHDATWYRNSTTVAPFTEAAVPAILSGKMPTDPTASPIAAEWPHTILTMLGDTYSMNVHESVTALCPDGACTGPPPHTGLRTGFGGMLSDVGDLWWQLASPERTSTVAFGGLGGADQHATVTASRFVESLQASSSPRLDLLHLLMPHAPWHYTVYGQDYESLPPHTDGLAGDVWRDEWVATLAKQRHILQVQAVDSLLRSVILRLKAIGAYDDSMIVVTADHGADFTGHRPFRGAASDNLSRILWTPLFIKTPNQVVGGADDRPARSIDVVPTIADVLGVKVPYRLDGRSLRAPAESDTRRSFLTWSRSEIKPERGKRYVSYDPVPWFAKVRTSTAVAAPAGDPMRLYRIGPLAAKVGEPVAPWIAASSPRGNVRLDNERYYPKIDPSSPFVSWMDAHGFAHGVPASRWLAIAVNGRLAGTYRTYATQGGKSEFWGLIPPSLFRKGANDVRVYELGGTLTRPVLTELRLT